MVWYSGSKGIFTIRFAEDLAKQVRPTNLPKLLLFCYGIDSGIDASGIFGEPAWSHPLLGSVDF
jgi:hypothetical protein